jgi:hypothetical protein
MRDLQDDTWNRVEHFSAQVDSIVRAQPAFRQLRPSRFRPM